MVCLARWVVVIATACVPTSALMGGMPSLSNSAYFGSVFGLFKDQCRYIEPTTIASAVTKTLSDPLYGLIKRASVISQLQSQFNHHYRTPQSLPLVLMLTGQPGTGKTFTARLIRDTVFLTPDENAGGGEKWGFVEFIASDYMHKDFFDDIFVPRLLAARKRCNAGAPVMVFLDEVLKIGNTDSSEKVAAVVRDALKEGKISISKSAHIDVRNWVFIMATDINAQSESGRRLQDFLFVHRDTDPSDQSYRRSLENVMVAIQDDQRQSALFTAFDMDKVLAAGNVVVYAPYEKSEISYVMDGMIHGFIQERRLQDQLFPSSTLTTFMKEKLVFEQMAIASTGGDSCSGSQSLWTSTKERSCEPFQVVQDGAASIRRVVKEYLERPVIEMLELMLEEEVAIENNKDIRLINWLSDRTANNVKYVKNVQLVAGLVAKQSDYPSESEAEFTFRICKILPTPVTPGYEHSALTADTAMRERIRLDLNLCPENLSTDYTGLQLFYYEV